MFYARKRVRKNKLVSTKGVKKRMSLKESIKNFSSSLTNPIKFSLESLKRVVFLINLNYCQQHLKK